MYTCNTWYFYVRILPLPRECHSYQVMVLRSFGHSITWPPPVPWCPEIHTRCAVGAKQERSPTLSMVASSQHWNGPLSPSDNGLSRALYTCHVHWLYHTLAFIAVSCCVCVRLTCDQHVIMHISTVFTGILFFFPVMLDCTSSVGLFLSTRLVCVLWLLLRCNNYDDNYYYSWL